MTLNDMRERLSVELTTGKTVLTLTASASSPAESQRLASLWLESFTNAIYSYMSRKVDQALQESNVVAMRVGFQTISETVQGMPVEREQALEIAAAVAYADAYAAALRDQAYLSQLKRSLRTRTTPEIL